MTLLLLLVVGAFVVALRDRHGAPLPQRPVTLVVCCAVVAIGYLGQRFI